MAPVRSSSMAPPAAPRAPKRHASFLPNSTWRRSDSQLLFGGIADITSDFARNITYGHKRPRHTHSKSLDLEEPHRYLPLLTLTQPPSRNSLKENIPSMAFLAPPTIGSINFGGPKRAKSSVLLRTPKDELDEFLSSDLELEASFASTSISSPPHAALDIPDSPMAMDISPQKPRAVFTRPTASQFLSVKPLSMSTRPRSLTATEYTRPLQDVSNIASNGPLLNVPSTNKSAAGSISGGRKLARPGLPMMWMAEPEPSVISVAESDHAMDVDSCHASSVPEPSSPISAAPTITSFKLPAASPWDPSPTVTRFHDLSSPPAAQRNSALVHVFSPGEDSPAAKKMRRSMTPGKGGSRRKSDEYLPSPSRQVDESPAADRALRRMASGSLLARLAATAEDSRSSAAESSFDLIPAPQLAPAKRLRRPALGSTLAPPSLAPESGSNNTARHSAHGEHLGVAGVARPGMPPRRAFSAMGPPAGMSMFDESSSFENSMEMTPSDPAARKQARTLRRCDGAEELRQRPRAAAAPLVPAPTLVVSPAHRINRNTISESPSARYMISNGLPGFGDNEAMGKVLPCHRVAEDGLMRIKPETLTKLLDGAFRNQIVDFRVIDCRFEYEYQGGHIPGAINLNTNEAIEQYFLSGNCPVPSTSADKTTKSILVFHCEFSAKRAPTFAKHLRSQDRLKNNHCYPKIHFPEVYILEGGYCQYFKEFAPRCQPSAYVRMDDPEHLHSRREDLDQFRRNKIGRTKSYAYGDMAGTGAAKLLSQVGRNPSATAAAVRPLVNGGFKRHTAPGGAPTVFAAANAARTRRGSQVLGSLVEDGDTTAGEETDQDIGDSPCPPPTKSNGLGFKVKKIGRAPLLRAETCGPLRLGAY